LAFLTKAYCAPQVALSKLKAQCKANGGGGGGGEVRVRGDGGVAESGGVNPIYIICI